MSMFYELMMRKKEEIMYATIKGTLTENDGVFSGFSASSYLLTQQEIPTYSSFEFCFKFTFGNDITSANQIICAEDSNLNMRLWKVSNETFIKFRYYNQLTSSNSTLSTNYAVQPNTTYVCKVIFSGTKLTISLYNENNELLTSNYVDNVFPFINQKIMIGSLGTTYFGGSIDLPNSYIKLGATKYNLQAVVGYTIVGSPTIVDGVVSEFSSRDYLQLGAVPNINQDFEMQCKFTTGNTIENGGIISSNNYYMNGFRITNGKVAFSIYFDGAVKNCTVDTNIATNTTYIAYAKRVGNNINVVLYDENKVILSTNNLSVDDYTISLPAYSYLGYGVRSGTFNGSIDLNNNNTYIKLGNKLWFNGQQA